MGQFESHQRSAAALQVFFEVSEQSIDFTLAKLEELSKMRYANQISKWDLMHFLQINSDQVKKVTALLSNEVSGVNNTMLSIHLVMVALVLCKESLDRETMLAKVRQIFQLVSFILIEGQIQKTEVRYVYHLVELWISAVASGNLPAKVAPNSLPEVNEQLNLLEQQIFVNPDDEMASLDTVCAFIEGHQETLNLISLFQNVSISGSRKTLRSQLSTTRGSQLAQTSPAAGARRNGDTNTRSSVRQSQKLSPHRSPLNESQLDLTNKQEDEILVKDQVLVVQIGNLSDSHRDNRTPSVRSQNQYNGSSRLIEVDNSSSTQSPQEDGAGTEESKSPKQKLTLLASPMSNQHHGGMKLASKAQVQTFGADLDLHWTTDVIQKVINNYSIKLGHYEHERILLNSMQDKLCKYRDLTKQVTQSDRAINLKDLQDKLNKIQAANTEYFGHRHLPFMMKSFFFQQQLVNTGFSITDFVQQQMSRVRASEDEMKDIEEDRMFEEVMTRAYCSQAFREFYKHHLIQLKYELKTSNARMLHYMSQRGQQRMLEKKKYKALGEMCSLGQMLEKMQENHQMMHIESRTRTQENAPKGRRGSFQAEDDFKNIKKSYTGHHLAPQAKNSVPAEAFIFSKIYYEVEKLRSCKMSRRDLITHIDTKQLRKCQTNSISFWEGVLSLMDNASQLRTFAQLNFFREFYEFAQKHLIKDEKLFKKTLLDRQMHKQAFLTYNSQIGKIKGLTLAVHMGQEFRNNEDRFVQKIQDRIKQLMIRLEKLDYMLTNLVHERIQRKRVTKTYFKALGKVSAYNTIVKSLPCERIIDYLMIGMTKARSQEIIAMVAYQDRFANEVKTITQAQLLTAMQKINTISTIDQAFNLQEELAKSGETPTPSMSSQEIITGDTQEEYARFQDELSQLAEMQRLMSEAPDHPVIDNLEKKEIKKEMLHTVATMLTQYFLRSKIEMAALQAFQQFAEKKLRTPSFQLAGSLTYKQLDLEDAGKVMFDFIDLEDKTHVKTDDLISWLGTLSCSLMQTYFHGPVEQLITHSQEAHLQSQKFASGLQGYSQSQYKSQIRENRLQVLDNFVQCLRGTNKGHLLNNLDMQYMSLPLEYSLENNFWLVQALNMQLNYHEREMKFTQMDQMHSPILLSKRSLSLKKKIAAQLILAAFDVGPQSVHCSESEHDEMEVYTKDKIDFDKQFQMTKGEHFLELKVKRFLFADAEEFLKMMRLKTESVQKVRLKYIQKNSNGEYSKRDSLNVLIRELNDEAFDAGECGDLNEILPRYTMNKTEFFEKSKHSAVVGIIGGAKNYLDKIIKLQTKESNIGQNQTLVKLSEFIGQIHDTIQGKPTQQTGRGSAVQSPTSVSAAGFNELAERQTPSRNANEQTQISVNSDGTGVSYTGAGATSRQGGKPLRKSTGKGKKKKKEGNPLTQAEEDLINLVSKTKEIYQMVFSARKSVSTQDFFRDLNNQYEQVQKMSEKVNVTNQFAKTNIDMIDRPDTSGGAGSGAGGSGGAKSATKQTTTATPDTVQKQLIHLRLNADKIGAKIIQEVQAGNLISPVFIFEPNNVTQLGLPPQYMTKFNEVREPSSSTPENDDIVDDNSNSAVKLKEIEVERMSDDSQNPVSAAEEDIVSSQLAGANANKDQSNELSEHQKAINFILQFIDQVSQRDDKVTIKMLLRGDSQIAFLQQAFLELEQQQTQLQIYERIHSQQHEIINVFDLQVTPIDHYLKDFQRISKYILRDLLSSIQRTDEDRQRVFFDNVIAKAEQALIKTTVARVDSYYQNLELDEPDKLDFQTAQVKIRRELDQKLHTFKEYVDLEENKQASQIHHSLTSHQEQRINQEIASMQMIIRTYYLKQLLV